MGIASFTHPARFEIALKAYPSCDNPRLSLLAMPWGAGCAPMENFDRPAIIEKYSNRRLHHTGTFSFVTLDDLAAMVKRGKSFLVCDAKTGTDITQSVLAQIDFEQKYFRRALWRWRSALIAVIVRGVSSALFWRDGCSPPVRPTPALIAVP